MIRTAILLGDHIQALGVSRIVNRLGLEVYLFNSDLLCLTRFSNTCKKFYKFTDEDNLLKMLIELSLPKKSAILIPTNDAMVNFISKNYEELEKQYVISTAAPKIADICYNKRKTYQAAEDSEVPYPESQYPDSLSDLEIIAPRLKYPVIIKPAVMHSFFDRFGKKVFYCETRDQLFDNYSKARTAVHASEIIIQQFLSGGAQHLFSFCSFSVDGRPIGSFVANRVRQKPMDFGISTTFARTVVDKRIDELAEKFLKGIRYFGLSEVEFMYDPVIKDYKLIEINPRTWKWHTISKKVDINLIEMMLRHFNGEKIYPEKNIKEGIGWVERLTDTYVLATEYLKGNMKLRDFFRNECTVKESACFDSQDPLPAVMYILLLPYLLIKRT